MKIILAGAGDIGEYLAGSYSKNNDVVLVDSDSRVLSQVERKFDVMPFCGSSSHQPTLDAVGASKCDIFVGVTGSDEVNMLSASLAHKLGSKSSIARIDSPNFYTCKNQGIVRGTLGITSAVCSSRLISIELQRKWRSTFSAFVRNYAENNLSLFSCEVRSSFSFFDKNIGDIVLGKEARIVAVLRDNILQQASSISNVYEGDVLLVASIIGEYQRVMEKLDSSCSKRSILIVGGGDVGTSIAVDLNEEGHDVRVFDKSEEQCEILANTTKGIEIIYGDGTDMALLEDQKVNSCDSIFSVTKADEVNLMSCLISKEIGIENTFSLVHRPSYSEIYSHLGITGTTSTPELFHECVDYLTGTDDLTHKHEVLDSNAQVYEIYIPQGAVTSGKRISDFNFPDEVIFCAYYSKEVHGFDENPLLEGGAYYIFLSSLTEVNFMSLFKGFKK